MVSAVTDTITSFFRKQCTYRSCALCQHIFPDTMLQEDTCDVCTLTT